MKQRYEHFEVVRNHLGRYAIWPVDDLDELPSKWASVGYRGSQHEVREYIREHWPEIRDWDDEDLDEELTSHW